MGVKNRKHLPPQVAPAHLRGRMSKHVPKEIRAERAAWIRQQCEMGYTQSSTARALGISVSSVRVMCPKYVKLDLFDRPVRPPKMLWGKPCSWPQFTPEQRRQLYAAAEKHGCETPGEFMTELVRDWLAENAPAPPATPETDRVE